MDRETGKVLLASIGSISSTLIVVDLSLKVAISALTLWYIWRKISPAKNSTPKGKKEDEQK